MTALVQQQTPVILRAQQQQQQDHALKSSSNSNISSMNSSSSSSSGSGSRKNSGDGMALASYMNSKLRPDQQSRQDAWSYQQVMMAPSNTALPVTNAAVTAASVGPVEWSHPQYHPTGASSTSANPYYYYGNTTTYTYDDPRQHQQRPIPSRSSRPRTPSETSYHSSSAAGIQVQKSSSTPIRQQQQQQQQQQYNRQNRSSQLLKQQQQQHIRRERQQQQQSERPPSLSSTTSSMPSPAPSLDSGRRSSITSVSSGTFSIRSEMSVNTKLSLSKRLRKVFSMSHLRSKDNLGMIPSQSTGSNLSLATVHESGDSSAQQTTPRPSRRRSFASLFQKHQQDGIDTSTRRSVVVAAAATATATSAETTPNERPALRVDTTDAAIRRSVFKGESPRIKSRSEALPSPTSSISSSVASNQWDESMGPPPAVGLHYGLPLHGSPRLKPAVAASSTSSLNTMTNLNRKLQFCPTIQVHETFAASEYDRRCDANATCQKMTPVMAMKIKQELNEYKLTDMEVHVESRQYTHFFL